MKLFPFSSSSSSKNKKLTTTTTTATPRSDYSSPSSSSSSSSDASITPKSVLPDGKFTKEELQSVLIRIGSAEDEIASLLAQADPDEDGLVDVGELLRLQKEEQEEELRAAFGVYDANGDGKISAEELCEVLRLLGDGDCTVEDCRRMIGGVDSDGDGLVCFRDFARMMSI